ncbi:uncharacterized protein LOC105204729 [Solenopsis invicta]|uniref:uncharacterized protein LOC105204729 n=1 Tax=Solenopsis invicta TaxID=13686 RepID=UPI000595936B|nr:uncharacterized protein LOC105204729 [Solenopsis invicta]XP_039314824.1 uncharacterized protein LOC105204729 [Solenopsis invicta]
MVPVPKFPSAETSRARRRRTQNDTKCERNVSEQMPRNGTLLWLSENYSWKVGMSPDDYRRIVVQCRKDLLSLIVDHNRVHHSHLSNVSWMETQRILRSKTVNPENQQQESQVEDSHSEDSSCAEKKAILPSPLRIIPSTPQPYRDDDKFAIKATLAKIYG